MRNYTITCESGTVVLVRHSSAAVAEREWDLLAAAGDAEPRVGPAEPASRSDVRRCGEMGHDYR